MTCLFFRNFLIFFQFFFAICDFKYIFAPHLNRKNKKMKKISFAFAAVALFAFAACNKSTETTGTDSTGTDSAAVTATTDSATTDSASTDSAAAPATTEAAPAAH